MSTAGQRRIAKFHLCQAALAGATLLLTACAWALTIQVRHCHEHEFRISSAPIRFRLDPFLVGITFQQLVLPIALIYLLSSSALFKRIVGDQAALQKWDRLKLFGALAAIQILFINYDWLVFGPDRAFLGLLVVVTGGWLGGWRVGLGLGLITLIVRPTQYFITISASDLLTAWREGGWLGIREVAPQMMFVWYYAENLPGFLAPWAGAVTGMCTELLGKRRFSLLAVLGMGSAIDLAAGYMVTRTWANQAGAAVALLSSTPVSGLALAAIVLAVRNVQAETVRRRAKAVELASIQAELRALRAQINPHFLFNALNTIRYFVRTDPETARRLLLDLSEIFQRALRSGEFVPLQDEISYVKAYLALEKARLDERLQIEWSIAPQVELDYQVPTLILQPIVENAVIHGIARKPEGGTVRITLERVGSDLLLQVEDDGEGISPVLLPELLARERGRDKAIGLRNVDGRLRALYGEVYRLTIESEIGRGTRVAIRIPVER